MTIRQPGLRGKLAAVHPAMGTLSHYITHDFPIPPSAFDYASDVKSYPMALNDTYGDCTVAGIIHLLQLAYAEIGEVFQYPGDDAVKSTYFDLTGGADAGCVEHDVLQKWSKDGLFGTKIAAYAPLNINDRDEFRAACYMFGAVYLGVEMPQSAEQQFAEGQPWTVSQPPQPPVGGHCIVATGVNNLGMDVVTWGALQPVTWDWWDTYKSEAWVVIPEPFVEIDHGPLANIDILQLQKDIAEL